MPLKEDLRAVRIEPQGLEAIFGLPERATGIVVFAHGSGSGRLSPRNNKVAAGLRGAGLATLLLDLLTAEEEPYRANVFDIDLLASRLSLARRWIAENTATRPLPVGYFGASTGAAAALAAAAQPDAGVAAVVSRGGRPDLAMDVLDRVGAPTLLIVGSLDEAVIGLNQLALEKLGGRKQMAIVEGAGHLFEEAGTLDEVVRLAADWFSKYLRA